MDLRTEILNLKSLLSITDLPPAVDNIVASLDASGIMNTASLLETTRADLVNTASLLETTRADLVNTASLLETTRADLASSQERLSSIEFDREVQAAVDRLDFAEVARLKNNHA